MIKKSGFILILILMIFGEVYAQSGDAVGKLIDKDTKLSIQNANVTVYNGKNIVYHTASDSIGRFAIPVKFVNQTGYVKISSLNYADLRIILKPLNNDNNTAVDLGTFQLTSRAIELKEVKINSKKRYRDTTKIDLSKQKFDRTFMVDDLFSGKFGFTKDEKGQLYYKGKLISDLVVNGGNFFGKNNTDIYQLLPALVLDNIEVTETNIDSVTNTTLQTPQLKVNLKFKDKYNAGVLGNINLGAGTAGRYVANTGLYRYKNNEQISLTLNTNNLNIGDNTIVEPKVDFSANGNNSVTNSSRFTYRNVFAKKIEVNFAVKGKLEDRKFTSETDRQEENIHVFSETFNSSHSKSFNIEEGNFNVYYKIDTLNTLSITQIFNHLQNKETDSLNYLIRADSSTTSSTLHKTNNSVNNVYSSEINYQKKFASKRGRTLTVDVKLNTNTFAVKEVDNVNSLLNQQLNNYFINGNRHATENKNITNITYSEPLNDSSYVDFSAIFERNKLNYDPMVTSDTTLISTDQPAIVTNNFFKPRVAFQRIFTKVVFNAEVEGIFDIRNIAQPGYSSRTSFLNLDMNFKADYKINKAKSIALNYLALTTYPNIQQLTSLNNTFDLISQTTNNVFLKPEEKKTLKLDYMVRPSDQENIILGAQIDHYSSIFGYRISSDVTSLQTSKTDNLGSANGGELSFTIVRNFSAKKYLNYTNSISYQEAPTIINNKVSLNNGISVNQSLSTTLAIVDSVFSIAPILTSVYSKYFYQANTVSIFTLIYYDKLSIQQKDYQLSLFPLFNYNHSVNSTHSFSMNGELRKSFLKKTGTIWVQAYDIFNSFKFYNNNIGASYYQSVKYSTVNRYIILGLSYKFNNIK